MSRNSFRIGFCVEERKQNIIRTCRNRIIGHYRVIERNCRSVRTPSVQVHLQVMVHFLNNLLNVAVRVEIAITLQEGFSTYKLPNKLYFI